QIWKDADAGWLKLLAELFPRAAADAPDPRVTAANGLNDIVNVLVDQIRTPAAATGASDAQAAVDGLEVAYFVGKRGLYRVSRDRVGGTAARYTPIEEARLVELCDAFRRAIQEGAELPCTLSELVLGEVPELASEGNLCLVPDGPLNFIPFQALRSEPG